MAPPRDCGVLGVTSCHPHGTIHLRACRRKPCEPAELTPRLSETRSDDRELREAASTRRGVGDRERNCGERGSPEARGEPVRKEPGQRKDNRRNQENKGAEILGHRLIAHAILADTAQTCAEHEQDEGNYRCPVARRPEEITVPHEIPHRKYRARRVPRYVES